MRPFHHEPTPTQTTRRPLGFLLLMLFSIVAIVAVLPRLILPAASFGSGWQSASANSPSLSPDEKSQVALLSHAADLLDTKRDGDRREAARLLDTLPPARPLVVYATDSTDNTRMSPFSSTLLVMRLGRQMDAIAQSTASAPCSAEEKANALLWTYRLRRLADAALADPTPSFESLKIAHYLDTLADRREVALYRTWGDTRSLEIAVRRSSTLRRVWNEEVLPLASADTVPDNATAPSNGSQDKEKEWAERISRMITLYKRERPFMSQA